MDISVPSRFSCLKIEDDEFRSASSNKTNNKKKQDKDRIIKKNISTNSGNNKKNGANKQQSSGVTVKKNKQKGKQESKQWEDWKKKDDEFVNDNYEQDLQCAILQSKIDFETQKKDVIVTSNDKNKKKKTKTMSLDQFLENEQAKTKEDSPVKGGEDKEKFFENALDSAKKEIKKDKVEEKRRQRSNNIEEVITLAQCQEKLEKEKAKNEKLLKELEEARKEFAIVKKRNITLCSMLSQGEMKDKAAVLLELESLTTVKEELTEEVGRLYKLLEQERSSGKNGVVDAHAMKHKEKTKKKKN